MNSREELYPGGEFVQAADQFDSDSEAALEVIKVIAAIPEGRQNAISRAELAVRLNTSDRRARKLLELARCSGVIILNLQKNDGYFRIESGRTSYTAEEIEQLRQQEKQDTNRAMTILVRRKYIRQALKGAGVQNEQICPAYFEGGAWARKAQRSSAPPAENYNSFRLRIKLKIGGKAYKKT